MSDANLEKIIKILKNKGYKVKQPVDPMGLADKQTREYWIKDKHLKAFNFYKEDDLGEVYIILESLVSFEKAMETATHIEVGDITLPVISIDDLFKWESEEERLLKFMNVHPKKKLEWLYQMNKFVDKYSTKQNKLIRQKIRETR